MKTRKTTRAQLGEIIRAEAFAYGIYAMPIDLETRKFSIDRMHITVDGKTKTYRVTTTRQGIFERGAYDESRGRALFVVEHAGREGGQKATRMNNHNYYPDGWHIKARRLNDNGTYNPRGEEIEFYQNGCFNCIVPEVEVVEQLQ